MERPVLIGGRETLAPDKDQQSAANPDRRPPSRPTHRDPQDGDTHVALEATYGWEWLAELLEEAGL